MSHTIIVSDLHVPYQDPRAWAVCLAAIRTIKPETIVVIGDFADFYSVSSFSKDPRRSLLLEEEAGQANKELKRVSRMADQLLYCCGNHEDRLNRYIVDHASALTGLISAQKILLDGIRGVEWVKYRDHRKIGKVLYTHDVGHSGVYAGRHTLSACGHNVVFGHTHRGGLVVEGDSLGDRRFSLNVGWLGDIKAVDYMHRIKTKDWALGFGHIYTNDRTGMIWPSFVPVLGSGCYVAGKWVQA